MISRRITRSSVARASEQLDPPCSTQTYHRPNQLHRAFTPQLVSYYSFPVPRRVGGRVDLSTPYVSNLPKVANGRQWDSNQRPESRYESDTLWPAQSVLRVFLEPPSHFHVPQHFLGGTARCRVGRFLGVAVLVINRGQVFLMHVIQQFADRRAAMFGSSNQSLWWDLRNPMTSAAVSNTMSWIAATDHTRAHARTELLT